jgi:hypothetical protein
MMANQPRGQCAFCGHETTKGSMGKHLTSCPRRQEQVASAGSGKPQTLIHLRVQDGYQGTYWFDAEVRGTATLDAVDEYLRAIWLECCGHMSKFTIGGWGGRDVSKSRRVDAVFTDGTELIHIYDFGTESLTRLKAVGSRNAAPLGRRPIVLMARNLAPAVTCVECDQQASHLCQECQQDWDSLGTLCEQHAKAHPHEEYGEPIEIVNSPRLGLCGYSGPADPPY